MKPNDYINEDSLRIIEQINVLFSELSKNFNGSEYTFFFTGVDKKENVPIFLNNNSKNLSEKSIEAHRELLNQFQNNIIEKRRFENVIHLDRFKVVCVYDQAPIELINAIQSGKYDWIESGKEYVVYKTKKAHGMTGGYAFFLLSEKGEKLIPPPPFEGWHSSRFKLIEYEKLN